MSNKNNLQKKLFIHFVTYLILIIKTKKNYLLIFSFTFIIEIKLLKIESLNNNNIIK